MRCFLAVTASCLVAAVPCPASAQVAAPEAVAELVRIDAVVTDSDGKPVRDLKAEDFELLDEGKPQPIKSLVFVERGGGVEPGAGEEKAHGRSIVIVVDDLHIAPMSVERVRELLHGFLAEAVAPEDAIALVTTGAPGDTLQLSQDRASLMHAVRALVSRESPAAGARGAQLTPVQAELILRGDRTALQLAIQQYVDEPGGTLTGTMNPRSMSEMSSGGTPAGIEPEQKAAAREAQRVARAVLAQALQDSERTLGTLEAVLRGLGALPGRKLCLLVSDGFLVGAGTSEEQSRLMREVSDAALRSGAAVYALDSHGLGPAVVDAALGGPAAPAGLRERVARLAEQAFRETLQTLAADASGFLVRGTTEPEAGLRRMLADDSYYLLGHDPVNVKRDGRFHKLAVRLPRHPGLSVRTRRGYIAPDDGKRTTKTVARAMRVAAAPTFDEPSVRAALGALPAAGSVPLRLAADYLDLPPLGPQAIVQAHVDAAALRWSSAGGRHATALELVGGVYDASGNAVGPLFGKKFELDLGEAEYERARTIGLRYQQRLALRPGRYQVRMVAREPALSALGGAAQPLEIPDLGQNKLTLSGLFLSTSAAGDAGIATEGGAALRDAQLLRRFQPGDSLYFQLYVYNTAEDEKGAEDVVLQAQIRSGGKLVAASKPQPIVARTKDGAPLPESNGMPLEGLAAGRYELRVVVVDRKANATAFRDVEFTVE